MGSKESATKLYAARVKTMDARLKTYEKSQQTHKNAEAAYAGAKSAAEKAAKLYAAAVKAHCDAEALHAKAVKLIGHAHMAMKGKGCAKYQPPRRRRLRKAGGAGLLARWSSVRGSRLMIRTMTTSAISKNLDSNQSGSRSAVIVGLGPKSSNEEIQCLAR